MRDRNAPTGELPPLVKEKLAAFEVLRPEFESCFTYVQAMHGQNRLPAVPVASTVLYLHALWICDRKDHLLSIPRTTGRYEGTRCLELLRGWQEGDTASVVTFLQMKLNMTDFGGLTRQRQEAIGEGDIPVAERLAHGRAILLNRGFNLHIALDAIFALRDDELIRQVRAACERYKHEVERIPAQLAERTDPIYAYTPHPQLARRNMRAMNALGMRVTDNPADLPGRRTAIVQAPTLPDAPYAEVVIAGEVLLTSMWHNNPAGFALATQPLRVDAGDVVATSAEPPV